MMDIQISQVNIQTIDVRLQTDWQNDDDAYVHLNEIWEYANILNMDLLV